MPLVDLFRDSPTQVRDKQVHQLIAFAGEGVLRDGNATSSEFRALLGALTAEDLERLAGECLTVRFDGSGLALQDVINQVGRRLGFDVTDGRYRGTTTEVGFDGLWRAPEDHHVVVEVKTTDAYRVDLARIAGYRRHLVRLGQIQDASSSILIVVGRQDTGDLEAQIRGSRDAWDVRLISVDYLIKLVHLKESLEEPDTAQRIRKILVPQEFTRVDGIVDLVFSTAEDVRQEDIEDEEDTDDDEPGPRSFTPAAFHKACIARVAEHLKTPLVRKSRATFHAPDKTLVVVCIVSREYEDPSRLGYWYAFHPHQAEQLAAAERAFVALGCGTPDKLLLIPYEQWNGWLPGLNETVRPDGRRYWHVHIHDDNGRLSLKRKAGASHPELTRYLLAAT